MIAIDTNVLIYAIDSTEPVKQPKAAALIRRLSSPPVGAKMPWQVLSEFLRYLRRLRDCGDISDQQLINEFQIARTLFPIELPVEDVLDHALDLSSRYSLSHWDSMLLGACKAAGVNTLHTEDMGSPRIIDGIQLLNPFV